MSKRNHLSFTLVLAGGGARGLAHVGVLKALEHYGYRPSAIVGVSMGAIVGATYGLNPDWYPALTNMDTSGFPNPPRTQSGNLRERVRSFIAAERAVQDMLLGWGVGARALTQGQYLLQSLTLGRNLEEARIPVIAVATDLISGKRIILRQGNAAEAIYASSALAGLLPPLSKDGQLLADGGYADFAPVDIARELHNDIIIAVDPRQANYSPILNNGFQALLRAVEICHDQHARVRLNQADLILKPQFKYFVDTIDFGEKRACISAGVATVRASLPQLRKMLEPIMRQAAGNIALSGEADSLSIS